MQVRYVEMTQRWLPAALRWFSVLSYSFQAMAGGAGTPTITRVLLHACMHTCLL